MKRILALLVFLLAAVPAYAQQQGTPVFCNTSVTADTASNAKGAVLLVASPTTGAVWVCGYTMSSDFGVSAQLGFATAATGAAWFPLTPAWQFNTSAAAATVISDNGVTGVLFVPAGNGLFLSATSGAPLQASVHYWQQNTK